MKSRFYCGNCSRRQMPGQKRRMREAVRRNLGLLTHDVDVVLHPRRTVLTADFTTLLGEVSRIFAVIENTAKRDGAS